MDNLIALESTAAEEKRCGQALACPSSPLLKMLVRPSFQSQRAIARDVSRRGIGLYLMRALPVGSRLALHVRGPRRGASCIVSAQVVHLTHRGGAYLAGCRLSCPLSDGELESLL
jgi:hypothetical protein